MRLFVFSYNNEEPDGLCYVVNNNFYYEVVGYDEYDPTPYIEFGIWSYIWESRRRYL